MIGRSDDRAESVDSLVDHLFRHQASKLVATLTRVFGPSNLALAEDMVQETLLAALNHWSQNEIPENPTAWLIKVAKRKALNELKHSHVVRSHKQEMATQPIDLIQWVDEIFIDREIVDSQLRMIFACCHPSLSTESQLVLTLKILCGFSVKEVALALLTSEDVIGKRFYRAKQRFRSHKIPFSIPKPDEIEDRLEGVCITLYLLFNEGYNSSNPETIIRKDLCAEALRLTMLLQEQFPERSELSALLSLMCLHAARFDARLDNQGCIVIFEDQDRNKWNQTLISKGLHYLKQASVGSRLSEYHLEAGIAAEHCLAKSFSETNWRSIYNQHQELYQIKKNPIVRLNMAIISHQLGDTPYALEELEKLVAEPELQRYYLLPATLGVFYLRERNYEKARANFERAKRMTSSHREIEFLSKKMSECTHPDT